MMLENLAQLAGVPKTAFFRNGLQFGVGVSHAMFGVLATTPKQKTPKNHFFAALTFAHLAFCAAAILAQPAALIFRRLRGIISFWILAIDPRMRPSVF